MQPVRNAAWLFATAVALVACSEIGVTRANERSDPVPPPAMYPFRFNDARWDEVFNWLGATTGKPVFTKEKVPGLFTFIPAAVGGRARNYTIGEIIDILDDELAKYGLAIIARGASFLVYAKDNPPYDKARHFTAEDLQNCGKHEMAKIAYRCGLLDAEEIAPAVRKLLSGFSVVIVVGEANRLILIDNAASLRTALAVLDEWSAAGPDHFLFHQCKHLKAAAVADKLETMFRQRNERPRQPHYGPVRVVVDERSNKVLVIGPPPLVDRARALVAELDRKQ